MNRIVIPVAVLSLLLANAFPCAAKGIRLGARDIVYVYVCTGTGTEGKDLYQTYELTLNLTGSLTLPLIGSVKAAGLTADQLEVLLIKKLKEYYTDPQVSVSVKEYRSAVVYVLGQVRENGTISLEHEDTPLFEVIARAGGFTEPTALAEGSTHGADTRNIIITRGSRRIVLNYHDMLVNEGKVEKFLVQPGDYIFVPKPIRKVRVFGGVGRSGEIELIKGMTLLHAIAAAGSFTKAARRNKVLVMRVRNGKQARSWHNCDSILAGKDPDPVLEVGDTVFVAEWR